VIEVEHIEQWRGQTVVDSDGEQLGKVDEIYFDSASDAPVLIAIKSGLLGRHSKLVPVDGLRVGREYVRVAHSRESIDAAPETSGDGPPDQEELAALGTAYGLRFSDQLELQSAGELEARQAEAEAARRRAAELDAAASEKRERHEAASQRAQGAAAEANQAQQEADQAQRAAQEAREQAEKYEHE